MRYLLLTILFFIVNKYFVIAQEEEHSKRWTEKIVKWKQRKGNIDFIPFGTISYGIENNVFRSPKQVINSTIYGTQTNLEKNDSLLLGNIGFNLEKIVNKKKSVQYWVRIHSNNLFFIYRVERIFTLYKLCL